MSFFQHGKNEMQEHLYMSKLGFHTSLKWKS